MKTFKVTLLRQHVHLRRLVTNASISRTPAIQSFEDLYAVQKPKRSSSRQRDDIIHRATVIYQQHRGATTDVALITKFVKLCIDYERMSHFNLVWPDMIALHSTHRHHASYPVPYDLLFKCCIKSNDINKAIQILHWITSTQSELRITDSFITKLIVKCSNDPHRLSDLHLIHSLLG